MGGVTVSQEALDRARQQLADLTAGDPSDTWTQRDVFLLVEEIVGDIDVLAAELDRLQAGSLNGVGDSAPSAGASRSSVGSAPGSVPEVGGRVAESNAPVAPGEVPESRLAASTEHLRTAYRLIGEQDGALRNLVKAARDYLAGCECSGSGFITDCPGYATEGCCGACERKPCECCPELRSAIYEAEAMLRV